MNLRAYRIFQNILAVESHGVFASHRFFINDRIFRIARFTHVKSNHFLAAIFRTVDRIEGKRMCTFHQSTAIIERAFRPSIARRNLARIVYCRKFYNGFRANRCVHGVHVYINYGEFSIHFFDYDRKRFLRNVSVIVLCAKRKLVRAFFQRSVRLYNGRVRPNVFHLYATRFLLIVRRRVQVKFCTFVGVDRIRTAIRKSGSNSVVCL